MNTASARDSIFFDVPLAPSSLEALHAIAERDKTTPVLVLQEIAQAFHCNGEPPVVEGDRDVPFVRRGVPVTHELLQNLNEMAAQYRLPPLDILQRIIESELQRRARHR